MRLNHIFTAGVILALSLGGALAAGEPSPQISNPASGIQDENAVLLLKRMVKAMQTTNYEGLLLHMRGSETRSLRVFHHYDAEHGEREHLLSLDGKPFEMIQDAKGCTCVWPQSRYVVVRQSPAFTGRLSTERFADTDLLSAFYTITRQNHARVGGMSCRMVRLEPKDAYRFGYRLCMHESSAMLLNLEVFDGERRLELTQFTQLRVQRAGEMDDMRLLTQIEDYRVIEDKPSVSGEKNRESMKIRWETTQLPDGYRQHSTDMRTHPHTKKTLEHLIFSDGLSSVSVFIERTDEAGQTSTQEPSKHTPSGVMHRVVRDVDGYRLTAIGDAPEIAMRMILEGMRQIAERP